MQAGSGTMAVSPPHARPRPAVTEAPMLSARRLRAIIFIEGFCSLGAEVLALRQLVPQVGSSIVVTAPTIGVFLLALALGYQTGARARDGWQAAVSRNFLVAALLTGAGLSGRTVDTLAAGMGSPVAAAVILVACVLGPIAWLLGQTVPLLTNLIHHERAGASSGQALYHSTLGSFLGSVVLSLGVMPWLGVSAAVAICAGLLGVGHLLAARPGRGVRRIGAAVTGAAVAVALLPRPGVLAETPYADYAVEPVRIDGMLRPRLMRNNGSPASLIDESEPPRHARYVERIRRLLVEDLGLRQRDILVLGAGGFTLSHRETANRYTYVDIDPAIRDLAQQHFLREPMAGTFLAEDARTFVTRTAQIFDAVVVDVYGSHTAIPGHLVTLGFWSSLRRVVAPQGVVVANLLLDASLESDHARHLLATIERVYGRCSVEVLQRRQPLANVIVTCRADTTDRPVRLYTDERQTADLDRLRGP